MSHAIEELWCDNAHSPVLGEVLKEADDFIQDVHNIIEELYISDLLDDESELGRNAIYLIERARALGASVEVIA